MLPSEFYSTLAEDVGRVLVTGPVATARLAAIPNAWDAEEAERVEDERLLPAILRTPARKEPTMMEWIADNIARAREPFQPHWEAMLSRVKAKEWSTQKACADSYHKPARWITDFKKVVLAQKVMTAEEWNLCFKDCKGNQGSRKDTEQTQYEPTKS